MVILGKSAFPLDPIFLSKSKITRGKVSFEIGATHHGFKADATNVDGELEKLINEIREKRPKNMID